MKPNIDKSKHMYTRDFSWCFFVCSFVDNMVVHCPQILFLNYFLSYHSFAIVILLVMPTTSTLIEKENYIQILKF